MREPGWEKRGGSQKEVFLRSPLSLLLTRLLKQLLIPAAFHCGLKQGI